MWFILKRLNAFRLLNSVPFGIALMASIAVFMAVGSGRPWLRSAGLDQWPIFRDWFDKTDLEFFNAWPLKTLMALLVANLVVVTWRKIPLTPPRYGVWCIHAGIITLILGAAVHYSRKLEGRVMIFADPQAGPNTVENYYDKDERALYVRTGRDVPAMFPLPTLPRFQQYDDRDGTAGALRRRGGLTNLAPVLTVRDQHGNPVSENVAEQVNVKGDLRVDVVGFYPYAEVRTTFDTTDPASHTSGVELSMTDVNDPGLASDWYLVSSDPRFATDTRHAVDLQHVDGDAAVAAKLGEAAGQLFHIDVTTPGAKEPASMYVKLGDTVPIGKTGYTLAVLRYDPSWSMSGTRESVRALEMMVSAPTQRFRRMVLENKPVQTDFALDAAGAGPMGKRQMKPLDEGLKVAFRVEDPYRLLPSENSVKHTLVTPAGSKELVDVETGFDSPAVVRHFAEGTGEIVLPMPAEEMADAAAEGGHPAMHVKAERRDHLKAEDHVAPVPPNKRDENADENGDFQVAKLRLHLGDWSQELVVPFTQAAHDKLRQDPWRGGFVTLPGAVAPLQFTLGNTLRPLPTRLTLEAFKAEPYAGAPDTPSSMYENYRSTVTVGGADDSDTRTEVASLNNPIYFDGGRWLFFQASYDPNLPHQWTMLGIGNRPATRVMMVGCVMIVAGLLYAFYVKPVIIRRMKERAIASAAAVKAARAKAEVPELVA